MKKKALVSSVATIALCTTLIAGSTFALFTSDTAVNIAVTSGKVNVVATLNETLKTWSLGETVNNARSDGTFTNGGLATMENGELVIERMTPGDTVQFTIDVVNTSNVAIQYKASGISQLFEEGITDLSKALEVTAHVVAKDNAATLEENYTMKYTETSDDRSFQTEWFSSPAVTSADGEEIVTITVTVTFPNGTPEHDNPFQDAKAKIAFSVAAVQGNGVDNNGELIY